MSLFAAVITLLIEQFRPLPVRQWLVEPLTRWFGFLDRQFNDGDYRHGTLAWIVGVALPTVAVGALQVALWSVSWIAALAFSVLVLYFTMGIRQYSHYFTNIQLALRGGDLDAARRLVGEWRGLSGDRESSNAVVRLAIEQALVDSHRMLFAPLAAFALLGPAGAVLFRLALFAREYWRVPKSEFVAFGLENRFGEFAQRAFHVVNWLPIRLTGMGFAITGDFEDAVFCWRTQAATWGEAEAGILIASGAGALGVRLGMPVQEGFGIEDRPEMGMGDEADVDFMQSTIGLIWRTLALFLMVLALVWVASWVG